MCHFITATLPQGANIDLASGVFRSHDLGFKVVHNPHVSPQLNPGETYILTTRGRCDCGTALGVLNRHGPSNDLTYESEVANLRKQGWSGTKVQRWLKQKREAEEKRKEEVNSRAQGGMADAERWVNLVSELLHSGHANKVGVLLHLYHGGVETERSQYLGAAEIEIGRFEPRIRHEDERGHFVRVSPLIGQRYTARTPG